MNFAKFVRTPFLENMTGRLLLIIVVSLAVKGEFENENLNHKKQKLQKLRHTCPFESEVQGILKNICEGLLLIL